MDTPSHFVRNGKSIDKIPVDRFVSKSIIFKIPEANDPKFR